MHRSLALASLALAALALSALAPSALAPWTTVARAQPSADPPAGAQPSVAPARVAPERVERLEAWLDHQRHEMRFARHVVGPISLASGAIMFAPGVAGLADGIWDEQPNLGWLAFGVGGLAIAQGAVWLAIQSDPEERWERWVAAREAGLSETEVARFEGELRAAGNVARMERALIRWSGLGQLFGGGLYIGLTLVDDPPRAHARLGHALAGTYAAIGVAMLVYSFVPALGEAAWARYEAGLGPEEEPPVELSLAPFGGCVREGCGAGLSLRGAFH